MLSHVAWRAEALLKASVGESLGAACLCSAHGYADALSREGSSADPAERALSTWRRQNMFRWLSRPSGSADTAHTWHSSIHQRRYRHSVDLCAPELAVPCDEKGLPLWSVTFI